MKVDRLYTIQNKYIKILKNGIFLYPIKLYIIFLLSDINQNLKIIQYIFELNSIKDLHEFIYMIS
jgi:hypothetical protein